jgi:hypothetical protein
MCLACVASAWIVEGEGQRTYTGRPSVIFSLLPEAPRLCPSISFIHRVRTGLCAPVKPSTYPLLLDILGDYSIVLSNVQSGFVACGRRVVAAVAASCN